MRAGWQVVTVWSGWLVCCALCGAQAVPRPRSAAPVADGPISSRECPAAVPPATSESSASGGDYVELERSACAAGCVAYKVRVYGSGEVDWHGEELVETLGDATGSVSGDAAKALIQDVAQRGFWGLCSRYTRSGPAHARATFVTTLSIAGHTKRVEDNADAAPSWLRGMDLEIDGVADTHLWRHGGPMVETFGGDRLAVDTKMPKQGVTPLMKAATLPDTAELVKTIKLLGDPNQRDSSGWTALMYAAQAGPPEAMTLLLQAGADPNARTNEGETPLFAAVSTPLLGEERFRILLATGVDLNPRDHRAATPLMAASRFAAPRTISLLLAKAADPSTRSIAGETAVFWAVLASSDWAERFRILRAAHLDLNARDARGTTPLMLACRNFLQPEAAESLVELGADPSLRDFQGKTAMDYLSDGLKEEHRNFFRNEAEAAKYDTLQKLLASHLK